MWVHVGSKNVGDAGPHTLAQGFGWHLEIRPIQQFIYTPRVYTPWCQHNRDPQRCYSLGVRKWCSLQIKHSACAVFKNHIFLYQKRSVAVKYAKNVFGLGLPDPTVRADNAPQTPYSAGEGIPHPTRHLRHLDPHASTPASHLTTHNTSFLLTIKLLWRTRVI